MLERVPEVVGRARLDLGDRGVAGAACRRRALASSAAAGGGDLRAGGDRAAHVPAQVDVVHRVTADEGGVGAHAQVAAAQLVAQVDLAGDAFEELSERAVMGLQADLAGDPRVKVELQPGVAADGEQQLLGGNVVDVDRIPALRAAVLPGGGRLDRPVLRCSARASRRGRRGCRCVGPCRAAGVLRSVDGGALVEMAFECGRTGQRHASRGRQKRRGRDQPVQSVQFECHVTMLLR